MSVAIVAGCASTDIPTPQAYAPSAQAKLRASHHWDIVATDIAAQIRSSLGKTMPGARVYLRPPSSPIPFETAMHNFVTTRLVESGVQVATSPPNALEVTLSTQLVTHGSSRATVDVPLVAVAAGIMVAYNVAAHANRNVGAVAILGAAAAADSQRNVAGSATKTELIVTTSLTNGSAFLTRKTDIYYVEDADLSLFSAPTIIPTRVYRVEGSGR